MNTLFKIKMILDSGGLTHSQKQVFWECCTGAVKKNIEDHNLTFQAFAKVIQDTLMETGENREEFEKIFLKK